MAHFLEHLVFKGGEKYPTYRDVNEAATGIGAVLNAYTSHDLVAFHITARAERARRGRRPADRLRRTPADRRRGARPRARRRRPGDRPRQRPAVGDGRAPDRRGGVRRSPAGPPGARSRRAHPRHLHARRHRRLPLAPVGAVARAARSWSATSAALGDNGALDELFGRFPSQPDARALRAGPAGRAAAAGARARLQPVPPADVLPARGRHLASRASGRRWRSTRRCSAARWARVCSTRSASSGAWPTPCTRSRTRTPTCPCCSCRRAWSRRSASRPTAACARSSPSCASRARPRRRSSAPVRTRPVRARSTSRTPVDRPVRGPADDRLRRGRRSRRRDHAPGRGHVRPRWPRSPPSVPDTLSVACVGPHTEEELASA